MQVRDEIYGEQRIVEPVLQELIKSAAVQRLRYINQAGALKYTTPHATVTRYEHSIGVLILLQRLGASLKEQIAGLLHDVPHTAFSHVVDYALDVQGHDFHEQHHQRILEQSNIPRILEKHGFNIKDFLDVEKYSLLEQPAPALCADRIDYTLRDTQIIRRVDMRKYLDYFTTHNGRVVMTDAQAASAFAKEYMQSDKHIWANPREGAAYNLLANALRQALSTGLISKQDLWMTDDELFAILDRSSDEVIQQNLHLLNRNLEVEVSEEESDFVDQAKMRYINPPVKTAQGVLLASELDEQLLQAIQKHREWHAKEKPVRIRRYERLLDAKK